VLAAEPLHARAHGILGHTLMAQGRLPEAEQELRQALAIQPGYLDAQNSLASLYQAQGRYLEAIEIYRQAIAAAGNISALHNNLGVALQALKRLGEAGAAYHRALELDPNNADAYGNLGGLRQLEGNSAEAESLCRQALTLQPHHAKALFNMAKALESQGRLEEAAAALTKNLALEPQNAGACNSLGVIFAKLGRLEEQEPLYRRALAIQPRFAEAENNLGNVLQIVGRLEESAAAYRRALAIQPDYATAYGNLGSVCRAQGLLDEALDCYRRAMELNPADTMSHGNLLLCEQFRTGVTPARLAALHAEWERQHGAPLAVHQRPHENDRDPDRPLQLGFVSADLGQHPVGYFLIGTLEALREEACVTTCYSSKVRHDAVVPRIRAAAHRWRDATILSDEALVEQIRQDRIDVLFDLSGHTAENRLPVFARKPAPIQITWIGYEGTTGLRAMDYVLADRCQIPEGTEHFYQEQVLRLPDSYICYEPPGSPPVGPLPALEAGFVTLGSFNNAAKVGADVVAVWAEIMKRLPGSRLVLKHLAFGDQATGRRYVDLFAAEGIGGDRLRLLPWTSLADALDEYGRIDLGLDPFPFSGSATTCDALWMGVPVITCPGETFASRHSLNHLTTVGLGELVAGDRSQYVELAVDLARDLPRLAELRAGLRARMARSPLRDGRRLARNLMGILRDLWRAWSAEARA
jgi:predicted O-linked N-acetylglucosamine transferase (SPINDLY family)